jgi:hypothetical protein
MILVRTLGKIAAVSMVATAALATAVAPANASTVSAQVSSYFPCGGHSKAHFSYSYRTGPHSTKVYFYNHCGTTKYLETLYQDGSKLKRAGCIGVHAGIKGNKRFWHSNFAGLGLVKHC